MRFIFKTDYNQDIRLAKDGQDIFWYSCLGIFVLLAPWIFPEYWLDQLTFVLIYAIVFWMGIYYINRLIAKGPQGRAVEGSEGLPSRPLTAVEGAAGDAISGRR